MCSQADTLLLLLLAHCRDQEMVFPGLPSYSRMLLHRVAQRFGLERQTTTAADEVRAHTGAHAAALARHHHANTSRHHPAPSPRLELSARH